MAEAKQQQQQQQQPVEGPAVSIEVTSGGSFSVHMRRVDSIVQLLKRDRLPRVDSKSLQWVYNLTGRAGSCMYMAPVRAGPQGGTVILAAEHFVALHN